MKALVATTGSPARTAAEIRDIVVYFNPSDQCRTYCARAEECPCAEGGIVPGVLCDEHFTPVRPDDMDDVLEADLKARVVQSTPEEVAAREAAKAARAKPKAKPKDGSQAARDRQRYLARLERRYHHMRRQALQQATS